MRWFKHLTEASHDEKLADVLAEHGLEGYGFWWLLVETVALQMNKTERCELEYSIAIWSRKLYASRKKTVELLQVFSEKNLVFLESSGEKISVKIPKLLKLRDEYSKKSG